MSYPFNVYDEMLAYITQWQYISAKCRLSPDEEYFIISKVNLERMDKISYHMINRSVWITINRFNICCCIYDTCYCILVYVIIILIICIVLFYTMLLYIGRSCCYARSCCIVTTIRHTSPATGNIHTPVCICILLL